MSAIATVDTPLGPITIEATDRGVCAVQFRPRHHTPQSAATDGAAVTALQEGHLRRGVAALRDYFRGNISEPPALDLCGSAFDRKVWAALLRIPWGQTITYGELAVRIGAPGAARAVGAANGRNPVAILVPCHRVVATGGALGGYAGGVEVKRWLLAHEAGTAPR